MKKGIKYGLVIPGTLLLGFLLLLLLAALLLQTGQVKHKIAKIAEVQVSKSLNGNLSIGKIEGNFFTHLSVKNILLTTEQDTLAQIDEINAEYNLWPLLRNLLDIHTVEIIRPQLFLKQINDSAWNVQQIAKQEQNTTEPASGSPGSLKINLANFRLIDGFIKTATPDTIIPQKVEHLNAKLSGYWSNNQQQAELKQFSFSTQNPDFNLKQIQFALSNNNRVIELKNFSIETELNQLHAEAGFSQEQKTGDAFIESPGLKLSEFSYFLPYLKIPVAPDFKMSADMQENAAVATLELKNQKQKISLQITSENLSEFLSLPEETTLLWSAGLKMEQVYLAGWLGNPELPYVLNGEISASGRGTDPKTAEISLNGQLNDWIYKKAETGELLFDLAMNEGSLDGTIQGNGSFGKFEMNSTIRSLLEQPEFETEITSTNLNLEQLSGIKNLDSDINLTAGIKGEGFDPEKLFASAQINMLHSRIQHLQFDTLSAIADYRGQNLVVDSFLLKTKNALLTANGNYSFDAQSDLQLDARFSDVEEFYAWLPDSSFQASGTIAANLRGRPDSLLLETAVVLDSVGYNDLSVKEMQLHAKGKLTASDTIFETQLVAQKILAGNFLVDSISARAQGSPDSLFLSANAVAGDLSTQIKTGIIPKSSLKISLADWEINSGNQKWKLQQTPVTIEIEDQKYRVTNFRMASISSESEEFISINGLINSTGTQNFQMEIKNLNLEEFGQLLNVEQPVSGTFNTRLNFQGKHDSLIMNTNYLVTDAEINKLRIKNISGELAFANNQLNLKTLVAPNDTGKIEIASAFPLQVDLDSIKLKVPRSDQLSGEINIEKIALDLLKEMEISDDVTGYLNGSINLNGTVQDPVLNGKFDFLNTAYNNYRLRKLGGSMKFDNNLFSANVTAIPQDSGRLEAVAEIPVHYDIDSLKININPKDPITGNIFIDKLPLQILHAVNPSGTLGGFIDGNVGLSGTMESPNPEGNIHLKNALVKMPEYGIDYKDIGFSLNFGRNKVVLNDLLIKTKEGSLAGSGQIDFASDIFKGDISQSEIALKFNRFEPFNHRQFNMEIDGDITLGGKKGEVVYGGNISIPRSEINIPTVLRMFGQTTVPELPKPILVRELEKMQEQADSAGSEIIVAAKSDSIKSDYFDKFKGKLNIRIPRNTWIKNEDMYVEISGDVDLIKSNEYFEIFGVVDVVRGQYSLLGKTFVIDEGSIRFQGGEEMETTMDIKASYLFRNQQRAEQKLSVQISGTAESPEVHFLLDGSSVSEGDALSYILFGKSMDELSIDEQSNIAGAGGKDLAGKAAASILTSQLTSFLGDKLAVDYIEVKSDGGFDNATVVVGKYITNDLFVSYEQRFGETHENDIVKYEVKLEYELFRFLFFQLNNSSRSSGFDVIFKFDVK
ncbi:Autotransporter translocation and assembly factor TamB [Mariniphaga anaerophila]|uniref:Autotransporter translocation and assembly factor TamB n=1 Tax=Mariniphaga anaerophila TaxID=1484053 RepID=A0A1M4XTW0_9BACT|nr:translocation/assembly module TamB domain-containing protein [Mariniphaga anaerophila]SHE96885.1 Autotransporter translocation and assembly factor TamB [Mariniphaga anaerophila]